LMADFGQEGIPDVVDMNVASGHKAAVQSSRLNVCFRHIAAINEIKILKYSVSRITKLNVENSNLTPLSK